MSAETILTKYRPISFDECLGNAIVIKALNDAVTCPSPPHTYLFIGSAGIGKTTLARIIANMFDATINEIDAGTDSGVDITRNLVAASGFKPVLGKSKLMYIIDECHALSKQAWSPLLKLTEEPPEWLYIAFCTTDPAKIPSTIKTRSCTVSLKPLKPQELEELLSTVADIEQWKLNGDVFSGIVTASQGSARMALSLLQMGHGAQSRDELAQIIAQVESENNPAVKLAQALLKGNRNWKMISQLLEELDNREEEAIAVISRYLASCLPKSEEQQAREIWRLLAMFSEAESWDKKIQLYTGIGKMMWGTPF